MFKIDLHTHSVASPDGGLQTHDYREKLESGELDFIAVTDHNRIDFAQLLQKELGEKVIVGEEITATEGEIIGLFLSETVPPNLPAKEVVAAIRKQGGLVYIPHPFETVRKGLPAKALEEIANYVDIVEIHNGRALFQNRGKEAQTWAKAHNVTEAASSDAHGRHGWGKTYNMVEEVPTKENLKELLVQASYQKGYVGLRGALYPKLNRLQKKVRRAQ